MKKKFAHSIIIGCCSLTLAFSTIAQENPNTSTKDQEPVSQPTPSSENNRSQENSNTGSGRAGGMSPEISEAIPLDFSTIRKNNIDEMMSIEMSGYVDEDFSKLMAAHHDGAIEMAQTYLMSAQDNQLKQMAEKTISRQTREIEKLKTFVIKLKPEPKDESASKQLMAPMHKLMQTEESSKMQDGMDQAFATMMIDHHKAGIEMAEVEINKGKNDELKELAEKMRDDQQMELEKLESWLKEQK